MWGHSVFVVNADVATVLKLCWLVLGHSEVGEKLQRVACRGSPRIVDRKAVLKFLNCLKLVNSQCKIMKTPRMINSMTSDTEVAIIS